MSSPPLLLRGREAVRTAPLTAGYVTVLVTTTAVASTVGAQAGARLLSAFSTNLHELARVPMRVLVGSAFWAGGWTGLTLWALLLVPVVAPVERRLGGRRVFGSFAAAHVGATLLVAGGIWVGVRSGRISSIELVRDVGVS